MVDHYDCRKVARARHEPISKIKHACIRDPSRQSIRGAIKAKVQQCHSAKQLDITALELLPSALVGRHACYSSRSISYWEFITR